ncbi:MAG TPA: Uma2 family endonuclease [Gemmatimonadaceae bacterium]|nr:Uma2 family endonuclease [Gemmatimonadaceae bacterium]
MTAEEFMALPEDSYRGYELVRGKLTRVSEPDPKPYHGHRIIHIGYLISKYLENHPIAYISGESSVLLARDPDTVRSPDVFVTRNDNLPPHYDGEIDITPDLVIEVRSPSERPGILRAKMADYFAAGTSLLWVVDRRTRTVTIHRPASPAVVLATGTDRLTGDPVLPGFSCTLDELFR